MLNASWFEKLNKSLRVEAFTIQQTNFVAGSTSGQGLFGHFYAGERGRLQEVRVRPDWWNAGILRFLRVVHLGNILLRFSALCVSLEVRINLVLPPPNVSLTQSARFKF